jgi:hypothetical protein
MYRLAKTRAQQCKLFRCIHALHTTQLQAIIEYIVQPMDVRSC